MLCRNKKKVCPYYVQNHGSMHYVISWRFAMEPFGIGDIKQFLRQKIWNKNIRVKYGLVFNFYVYLLKHVSCKKIKNDKIIFLP